ncbi:uncharacterized protein METZ01_LOCUS46224, partial [marine metagenome]
VPHRFRHFRYTGWASWNVRQLVSSLSRYKKIGDSGVGASV